MSFSQARIQAMGTILLIINMVAVALFITGLLALPFVLHRLMEWFRGRLFSED